MHFETECDPGEQLAEQYSSPTRQFTFQLPEKLAEAVQLFQLSRPKKGRKINLTRFAIAAMAEKLDRELKNGSPVSNGKDAVAA
jgi:hypothetical protein